MLLDERADRLAEDVEQRGHQIEPHAARQQRRGTERQQIEMRRPARDRDELVGDRRHALDQNDPKAPLVELLLELREAALQPVEIDQPLAERLEKEIPDRITQKPARDRGDRAHARDQPRLRALRQDHRDQHDVGRDRKERTSTNDTPASAQRDFGCSDSRITQSYILRSTRAPLRKQTAAMVIRSSARGQTAKKR